MTCDSCSSSLSSFSGGRELVTVLLVDALVRILNCRFLTTFAGVSNRKTGWESLDEIYPYVADRLQKERGGGVYYIRISFWPGADYPS